MNEKFKYDVSVIVCTYNSEWKKLQLTIDSILQSANCSFEIIITDDGSKDNLFPTVRNYFKAKGFKDYKLIAHERNSGTVNNFSDGVFSASGEWIKPISPGDCIYGVDTLYAWKEFVFQSGCEWSFGKTMYYDHYSDEKYHEIKKYDYPIDLEPYRRGNNKKCRWNYFVLNDFVNGANTICKYNTIIEYLRLISNKVIYAEDNIYRLMMFDGIVGKYFPNLTVRYEYGSGISTSKNSIWEIRIHDDLVNANSIIENKRNMNIFQRKMVARYNRWLLSTGLTKRIIYIFYNHGLKIFMMRKSPKIMKFLR